MVGSAIAAFCMGKKVEQLREFFGVVNDFTPEEEKRIREEIEFSKLMF